MRAFFDKLSKLVKRIIFILTVILLGAALIRGIQSRINNSIDANREEKKSIEELHMKVAELDDTLRNLSEGEEYDNPLEAYYGYHGNDFEPDVWLNELANNDYGSKTKTILLLCLELEDYNYFEKQSVFRRLFKIINSEGVDKESRNCLVEWLSNNKESLNFLQENKLKKELKQLMDEAENYEEAMHVSSMFSYRYNYDFDYAKYVASDYIKNPDEHEYYKVAACVNAISNMLYRADFEIKYNNADSDNKAYRELKDLSEYSDEILQSFFDSPDIWEDNIEIMPDYCWSYYAGFDLESNMKLFSLYNSLNPNVEIYKPVMERIASIITGVNREEILEYVQSGLSAEQLSTIIEFYNNYSDNKFMISEGFGNLKLYLSKAAKENEDISELRLIERHDTFFKWDIDGDGLMDDGGLWYKVLGDNENKMTIDFGNGDTLVYYPEPNEFGYGYEYTFLNKDLNSDGIDEIILRAIYINNNTEINVIEVFEKTGSIYYETDKYDVSIVLDEEEMPYFLKDGISEWDEQ